MISFGHVHMQPSCICEHLGHHTALHLQLLGSESSHTPPTSSKKRIMIGLLLLLLFFAVAVVVLVVVVVVVVVHVVVEQHVNTNYICSASNLHALQLCRYSLQLQQLCPSPLISPLGNQPPPPRPC